MTSADSAPGVHAVGVICALGAGEPALRAALSQQPPAPLPLATPFWPAPLPQGTVDRVVAVARFLCAGYRTRCNALLLAAWLQIETAVRAARCCGSDRPGWRC